MIYLCIEDKRAPIFTERVRGCFPNSSIIKLNKWNFKNSIKFLNNSKPILSNTWLVLVNLSELKESQIENLSGIKYSTIIVYCSEQNCKFLYGIFRKFIDSDNIKIINVKVFSREQASEYVKSKIRIEDEALNSLVKDKNFMPRIEESLTILKTLDKTVTKKDIDKYININSIPATAYDLFYSILKIGNKSHKDLVIFLYNFRYASSYIFKQLDLFFSESLNIFDLCSSGKLTLDNLDNYFKSKKLKTTQNFVRVITDCYFNTSVDFETLIILRNQIARENHVVNLLKYLEGGE